MNAEHYPFLPLFQDNDFTKSVIEAYQDATIQRGFNPAIVKTQLRELFVDLVNRIDTERMNNCTDYGIASVRLKSLRSAIIQIAKMGLSLRPKAKEAYLSVERLSSGRFVVMPVIGVNGIKAGFSHSPFVKRVAYNIVFEGDEFTWYGEDKDPAYSHNAENSGNPMNAAFSRIVLNDSSVVCSILYRPEIDVILGRLYSQAQLNNNQNSPWLDYPQRCIRNALMRRTFADFGVEFGVLSEGMRVDADSRVLTDTDDAEGAVVTETDFIQLLNHQEAVQA